MEKGPVNKHCTWVRFRMALDRCSVFLVFFFIWPKRLFSFESDRVTGNFSVDEFARCVQQYSFFSSSKTLVRYLSLDHFSNLGNICPYAVCYWRGLHMEFLQTKGFRQDLGWYLLILQRFLVYHSLSSQATVP